MWAPGNQEGIMEMDLKHIIEKIKTEGVGEAEQKADRIVQAAKTKAKKTIEEAREEKEEIIAAAGKDAERLKKNAEEAIKQASRDAILALKESIIALFDRILKGDIAGQLTPEVLKEMILIMVKNLTADKQFDVEVLLNEKDKTVLDKLFFDALKKDVKKGVTLKVSPGVEHGFRIGEKGGSSYYDFSDEAIAEAFRTYLNPKIASILEAGNKK